MIPMDARTTVPDFDNFLEARGFSVSATVIGGAALQLMGIISRPTKDCDVLDPTLTADVLGAARDYATEQSPQLAPDWFNNGPALLLRTLPIEWSTRLEPLYKGRALELKTLGREDFLRSKLFALLDRNIDLPDCIALAPTREELLSLLPWLNEQDGNEMWAEHVHDVIGGLARKLGYEL